MGNYYKNKKSCSILSFPHTRLLWGAHNTYNTPASDGSVKQVWMGWFNSIFAANLAIDKSQVAAKTACTEGPFL